MRKAYEVIIVGAGPAGCSAASCLAFKGYGVLLVDKAKFPRDKVCGDGISPPALEVLDRLGVGQKIADQNPWRIDGLKISSPAGQMVNANFSQLEGRHKHAWIMPRKEFDFLLLQHVRSFPRVQVLENWEVKDLVYGADGIEGIQGQSGSSREEFTGKVIIGADGAHSRIAQKIFPAPKSSFHYAFAVRAYFKRVEGLTHSIEIHCPKSLLPGYGWIFPTGEESANVGVGISGLFLRQRDMRKLFQAFINENKFVKPRLEKAHFIENSLQGWPIPLGTFSPRRSYKNVLLIGDAGGFADFLTGEGIYYALRGGECAAQAVQAGLSSPGGIAEMGEVYERLWRKAFQRREYLIGQLLQRLVIKEGFLNFNIRRAVKNPAMAQTLASILCHQKTKMRLLW